MKKRAAKPPAHPRITALRAFALLRELAENMYYLVVGHGPIRAAVDAVRDALASHVRSALVKGRRTINNLLIGFNAYGAFANPTPSSRLFCIAVLALMALLWNVNADSKGSRRA